MNKILIISNKNIENAIASIIVQKVFSTLYETVIITSPYDTIEEYVNNNLNGPYAYKMIIVVSDKYFNADNRLVFLTRNSIIRSISKEDHHGESFIKSALKFAQKFKYKVSSDIAKLALEGIKMFETGTMHNITNIEILFIELGFMRFIDRFNDGLSEYTDDDITIINNYEANFRVLLDNTELYIGRYKGLNILVAISNEYKYKRRFSKYLSSVDGMDFGIIVNYDNQSIYIVNSFTDECNSSVEIAKDFCSKYTGDESAVGGKYNTKFLEFGTTLRELTA